MAADIFEQEMAKTSLFSDRNVLSPHYIPEILPHREKEIEHLMRTLAPSLRGKSIHNIFAYGKTGVGKTASIRHVIKKLEETKEKHNAAIDCVYINGRIINTKYQVLLKCAEYLAPDESFIGYPFSHLFGSMTKHVSERNANLIIILDELDKIKNLDDLVYTLTRANDELEKGHISFIGITNNATFKKVLDPRSRSTLCEEELVFSPYNAEQLEDILKQRVKKGYQKGVVNDSAVSLAAALAAQESGDARYALKMFLKAGELAELEDAKQITDTHVRKAQKGVENDIIIDIISSLPEHQKIVLYSIAKLTKNGGHYTRLDGIAEEKVLFSGEVYDKYIHLCGQLGRSSRSARWCREYINDLEMLGILTTTLSGKGVRGTTTLIRLAFPADKILEVIKKHFKD